MAGKLHGKVALITGASSGIGEATALALAAEGVQVAVAARRVDRLQALARRIEDQGGHALPLPADVADEAQVREMVGEVHTLGSAWISWSTTRVSCCWAQLNGRIPTTGGVWSPSTCWA